MMPAATLSPSEMRDIINENVQFLTGPQLSLFNRIHDNAPWKGWANCPDNQVRPTYDLVRRSLSA